MEWKYAAPLEGSLLAFFDAFLAMVDYLCIQSIISLFHCPEALEARLYCLESRLVLLPGVVYYYSEKNPLTSTTTRPSSSLVSVVPVDYCTLATSLFYAMTINRVPRSLKFVRVFYDTTKSSALAGPAESEIKHEDTRLFDLI